jgi:SAM-dependent methyltransferase
MTPTSSDNSVNAQIWEDLYRQGKSNLNYPNSFLVSLSHHLLDPAKHHRILDYGFGTGANLIFLARRGFELYGAEVSQSALDIVQKKLGAEKLQADLRIIHDNKVPFDDNSFDVVIAWQVLYYNTWETLHEAVREINRVLRPGGIFIGTMAAPGDVSQVNSKPLGNGLYQSNVPGQERATVLIVDKDHLQHCFPDKWLRIGNFTQSFEGIPTGSHWVVSYEK